jgi:hypothetical protein
MAGNGKFEDLHLGDLSLEPLPDPGLLNYAAPKGAAPVKMSGRNQKVADRRINPDRRKTPRFEVNRRSGKERRPKDAIWDPSIKNST